MPSDPASSIFPSRLAFLSSAPPVYPPSDYIPHQFDTNAHLNFLQAPTSDIILSDAPANMSFSTFHTFQSNTLPLLVGTLSIKNSNASTATVTTLANNPGLFPCRAMDFLIG